MIDIKIKIQGEVDLPPFTKIYQYDNDSENIFINAIDSIKNRLSRNLMININETLMFFAAYVTSELRDGKSVFEIEKNSGTLLSTNQVMIGVPESLRIITFEVKLDDNPITKLVFNEPIPATDYLLVPK